jgi:hypothetical protein
METTTYSRTLLSATGNYPPASECSWWCRRRQDLRDLLDTSVGQLINTSTGGALGAISFTLDQIGGKTMGVMLSVSEQIFTDNWSRTVYIPFLTDIAERAGKLKAKTTLSTADLIEVNQILKEICLVKNYYSTKTEVGIRQAVLFLRNEYIHSTTIAVVSVLNQYVASTGVVLNEVSQEFNYTKLLPVVSEQKAGTFSCFNYVASSTNNNQSTDNNGGSTTPTTTNVATQNNNNTISNIVVGSVIVLVGYGLLKSDNNNK